MSGDFKFKAKDFEIEPGTYAQRLADKANAKLKEWIDRAPRVYGFPGPASGNLMWHYTDLINGVTHTAKLVCIEEIKK